MSEKNIKFKVSTDKINLLFSGNEEFVSRNIKEFKNEIELILKKIDKETSSSSKEISSLKNKTPLSDTIENPYPNVLNFENDGKFHIIPRILDVNYGNKKAEKIKNIALIFLWASHHIGIEYVEAKTLRHYFSEKSLKDSNFSTIIANNSNYIISTGGKNSSNKSLKLSDPGKEAAEQLLSKLNEAGNS